MEFTNNSILSRGIPLKEFGINNWAFDREGALLILRELKAKRIPILGGDIHEKRGSTIELCLDNWYCDREPNESINSYIDRSILVAHDYINSYILAVESTTLFSLTCPTEGEWREGTTQRHR